jgi:hypothetical protein
VTEPAPASHPGLEAADVIAQGGWHPNYTRVLATASAGDYGFALVDGNGDGAELEAETWTWQAGQWQPGSSSGAGPLDYVGPVQTGGEIGNAYYAYGRSAGRDTVTISFEHRQYDIPVSPLGIWAFIEISTSPGGTGAPTPMS